MAGYGGYYGGSAYCDRTDIETIYGVSNVQKWADLDNDGDAAKITARIIAMIGYASEEIDDRLRDGPYEVPFSSALTTITYLSGLLAGALLYEARGVQDFESETGTPYHRLQWHRNRVDQVLNQILNGQRKLNATKRTQSGIPFTVTDG